MKHYNREDYIGSWLRNLESILKDEEIPEDDWAFVIRKRLSRESLKIIELLPDDCLHAVII